MNPILKKTDAKKQDANKHATRPLRSLVSPGLAITLALGVALTGCKKGGPPPAGPTATKAAQQNLATQVSVTAARIGAITQIQPVTGSLNAQNDVTVGAKLAGKLTAVYYREGDTVGRGKIVAQQDVADFQAQLDQQRANLASALTRLEQARVALKNAQTTLTLTDEQTVSAVAQAKAALEVARQQAAVIKNGAREQERQQAREAVTSAQSDLASAKADLESAKANQTRARSDLKRYQGLYRQQAVSAQQLDQAQATSDSADAGVTASQGRVSASQARVSSQQQALSLIEAGSRSEDILRANASVEQANQAVITAQSNRAQVNLRRQDVNTALAGVGQAQAGVQQAQAAVRLAEQAFNDAAIRAPIDGVVAERKAEPGQQIGAGKDVMRIVALDSIYFDAQLPETLYAAVTTGKQVTVTVDAFPNRTFRGLVSKIFPVASAAARNFTVRISLVNQGNTLRPSMFARGEIVLATHPHAVLIPRDAVLDNAGTTGRVFLVKNKLAAEQPVKLGFSNIKEVEITSGVQAGDPVVTVGQAQLQNGAPVQILDANPSGARGTQSASSVAP